MVWTPLMMLIQTWWYKTSVTMSLKLTQVLQTRSNKCISDINKLHIFIHTNFVAERNANFVVIYNLICIKYSDKKRRKEEE